MIFLQIWPKLSANVASSWNSRLHHSGVSASLLVIEENTGIFFNYILIKQMKSYLYIWCYMNITNKLLSTCLYYATFISLHIYATYSYIYTIYVSDATCIYNATCIFNATGIYNATCLSNATCISNAACTYISWYISDACFGKRFPFPVNAFFPFNFDQKHLIFLQFYFVKGGTPGPTGVGPDLGSIQGKNVKINKNDTFRNNFRD